MKEIIEKILNNNEQHLFYNSLHNAGFALKESLNKKGFPDGKGVYIYDTHNECRHNKNIYTQPSKIVHDLYEYLIEDILAFLNHENKKRFGWNIKSFPNTVDRWERGIEREELKDFIFTYQQEVATLLLISDKERIDKKVNLKHIAQKEICIKAFVPKFTESVKKAYAMVNEEKEYLYGIEYMLSPCICFDEHNNTYILLRTEKNYDIPKLVPFTEKEKEEIINMYYDDAKGNV